MDKTNVPFFFYLIILLALVANTWATFPVICAIVGAIGAIGFALIPSIISKCFFLFEY